MGHKIEQEERDWGKLEEIKDVLHICGFFSTWLLSVWLLSDMNNVLFVDRVEPSLKQDRGCSLR